MNSKRDNFSKKTKRILAARAGNLCSFPGCNQITIGPDDGGGFVNLGEAAHITAAASGGPRYNPNLKDEDRSSINNGIWLCRHHAKVIDIIPNAFPEEKLRRIKKEHEERIKEAIVQYKEKTTIIVSREGDIVNFDDFKRFLALVSSDSRKLVCLEICVDTSGFDSGDFYQKDTYISAYKEKEQNLKSIFYLMFSQNAKKFQFIFNIAQEKIEVIMIKAIASIFESNMPKIAGDEVLVEIARKDNLLNGSTIKVPFSKQEFYKLKESSFYSQIANFSQKLHSFHSFDISLADINDNDWLIEKFMPEFLERTARILNANAIFSENVDFASLYDKHNWYIVGEA